MGPGKPRALGAERGLFWDLDTPTEGFSLWGTALVLGGWAKAPWMLGPPNLTVQTAAGVR